MNSAILPQISGLEVRISITWEVYQDPKSGCQLGCSVYASGATSQDTAGSRPLRTSARKSLSNCSGSRLSVLTSVPVLARFANGEPGWAFWYWWKYSNELSP